MQQRRQTTISGNLDDLDLAPESTPYVLMAVGKFRGKNAKPAEDPLGPFPEASVQVFADLGLSSAEIAQYFGVTEKRILAIKTRRDGRAGNGRLREFARTLRGKLLGNAGG